MKHAAAPRVAGEVCTLLLLYCLFAPTPLNLGLLAAFSVTLLICGLAAIHIQKAILRLLVFLPAALFLLAADRLLTLLVLAVCWLYAAIRFTIGRFEIRYWVYRREFAVLTVVAIASSFLVAAAQSLRIAAPPGVIGFAGASILLGIYSLRVIRLGSLDEPLWCAYSALELVVPLGVAAGLSVLVWFALQGGYSLLKWLFGLIWEPTAPSPSPSTPYSYTPPPIYIAPLPNAGGRISMSELPDPPESPDPETIEVQKGVPSYVWLIVFGVLVVAGLVVLFLLLRRRKKKKKESGDGVEAKKTPLYGRRRKNSALSADLRIRAIYGSYLKLLQKKGTSIYDSFTSLDVQTAAAAMGQSPEAAELRQLYLIARYGDPESLGPKDAQRAAECLMAIQNPG